MRRGGWTGSLLFHLLLAGVLLLITLPVPDPPEPLIPIALLSEIPSAPVPESEPVLPEPAGETEPAGEQETAAVRGAEETGARVASEVGLRRGLDWVTPPPLFEPERGSVPDRLRESAGPLRRALAEGAADWADFASADTPFDSLLFIQQRLEELTAAALEAARAGAAGDRRRGALPEPGSLEDLRGTPLVPLESVAGYVLQTLLELGSDLWNRLLGRDPDAVPAPDLDLTREQIMAFAALDDRKPISIFEWYAGLHPDFTGGINRLQELAADLAERNLVTLDQSDQAFRYRFVVPRREVIDYYVSFLNRTPEWDGETRDRLIGIIAILVRRP